MNIAATPQAIAAAPQPRIQKAVLWQAITFMHTPIPRGEAKVTEIIRIPVTILVHGLAEPAIKASIPETIRIIDNNKAACPV